MWFGRGRSVRCDAKVPQLTSTMETMLHPAGGFEGPKTAKLEIAPIHKLWEALNMENSKPLELLLLPFPL